METISLVKDNQKDLNKRVKRIKKGIKSGSIKLKKNFKSGNRRNKKNLPKKANATIYLGHIPHGFYEDEMTSYFNQFGKVIRATVARSEKTGRSKGYGFVEFQDEDVAKIAAETMNNYLMFNRILKCRYIPPEERKNRIYVQNINPVNYPRKANRSIELNNKLKAVAKLNEKSIQKKTQKKIEGFKKFFEERGIDFTFKLNKDNSDENVTGKLSLDGKSNVSETDDQFGVLEIDESDTDIHFKTPPQVKKVIKRTPKAKMANEKALKQKELSSQSNVKKSQKRVISKKEISAENSTFDSLKNSELKGKNKKVKGKSGVSEEKLNKKLKTIKKSIKKPKKISGTKVDSLKKGAKSLLKKKAIKV